MALKNYVWTQYDCRNDVCRWNDCKKMKYVDEMTLQMTPVDKMTEKGCL